MDAPVSAEAVDLEVAAADLEVVAAVDLEVAVEEVAEEVAAVARLQQWRIT